MTTRTPNDARDHRMECVNRVPLFADLSTDDRRMVADIAVTHRYGRGEQVHRPGERPVLRIVHRGRVKVYRINESGAQQLLRILFAGDFHGETSLLTGRSVDYWAEALEPAEVCVLGAQQVARLLRDHPEVALRMLASVSGRLADAEQQVSAITGASVAQRLGEHLLDLAEEAGSMTFRLPSTKKDLASYLGTTPETVSRRLGAFQDAGLVRLGARGLVEIRDPAGLRTAAAGT